METVNFVILMWISFMLVPILWNLGTEGAKFQVNDKIYTVKYIEQTN